MISRDIKNMVYNIANGYIFLKNMTVKWRKLPGIWNVELTGEYLISVTDKCEKDTKSGKRIVRDSFGEIKYEKVQVPMVRPVKYKMHPMTEPIPLSDIIICYDISSEMFTCHSIDEVLRIIKRSPKIPINPYLDKPYPKKFIKKMKARYPERLLEVDIKSPKKPRTPWTPTSTPKKFFL